MDIVMGLFDDICKKFESIENISQKDLASQIALEIDNSTVDEDNIVKVLTVLPTKYAYHIIGRIQNQDKKRIICRTLMNLYLKTFYKSLDIVENNVSKFEKRYKYNQDSDYYKRYRLLDKIELQTLYSVATDGKWWDEVKLDKGKKIDSTKWAKALRKALIDYDKRQKTVEKIEQNIIEDVLSNVYASIKYFEDTKEETED